VLAVAVVQPESRGTIMLSSRDPKVPPVIDDNFLDTDRDRRRMVEAVGLARRIARNPAMAPFLSAEMFPGDTVGDDELPDVIEAAVQGYGHPTASAPMGPDGDGHSVVDGRGAVYGIAGLRVIDASIIPRAPSAATNLTTIMLAERISSQIRAR
jgi:choline dehydrogenase